MAIAFSTAVRNARLDQVDDAVNAGGAGSLILYSGSRPATGGAATTEVATLTFSATAFGAASSATLTANAITSDTSATGGTATWFRVTSGGATFVMDGNVGTSGSDLNLDNNVISAGATVAVSSFVLTDGNA